MVGRNNEKWIEIKRTKTKVEANIPILPIAKEILDSYKTLLFDDTIRLSVVLFG